MSCSKSAYLKFTLYPGSPLKFDAEIAIVSVMCVALMLHFHSQIHCVIPLPPSPSHPQIMISDEDSQFSFIIQLLILHYEDCLYPHYPHPNQCRSSLLN